MKASILLLLSVFITLPSLSFATDQSYYDTQNYCEVQLENVRGQIVDRFSDTTCRQALRRCDQVKRSYPPRRQRRLQCRVTRNNPVNPPQIIDEVVFYDERLEFAMRDCEYAQAQDYRCVNSLDFSCTTCNVRRETNESFYSVYVHRKIYVNTYHAYSYTPEQSYQYCKNQRYSMYECRARDSRYLCGPCSFEPNNNHSQFHIYRR